MKKIIRNSSGITLVALVVTIVILLILAGITITYVMGDNSVFKQASKSKVQTEIAKIEERAQMIYSNKLMENAGSNLKTKVETSEVIEQLKAEGYKIKGKAVSEGDITGISLDKENMTIGKSKTTEIKVTYEGVEEPFVYYVEVDGKYYQMHSTKGFITIDREPSNVTKEDFETEDGEGGTANLTVTSSKTEIATAKVKENSNNTIEITSTETEGETVITVTYGSHTKTCTVKVVEPVLATNISLNEAEYVVTGGESWTHDKQLVATLEPSNVTEKEVAWKSSNPEIATVDETGLVKAGTKGGEVTITATTKDGSNLSATCKITSELFGKINASSVSYTDSDGNIAKIPDGYAVGTSENVNKVTGGLVAQDNEGNQFVWIPVGEVKKAGATAFAVTLGRYNFFIKDKTLSDILVELADTPIVNSYNNSYYRELTNENGSSYENAKAKDLQSFIDNTILDGGYWFGRYEASNSSGPKTKYNEAAWIAITQPSASTEAQKLKSSGTYQSDLVNSYAWDTAIVFIENSGHTGYASQSAVKSTKLNTGKSGDKVCNIYDLSSNCCEWNTETYSWSGMPCTSRGGLYNDSNLCTSYRNGQTSSFSSASLSFRTMLYRP